MSKVSEWLDKCDDVVDEQPIARLGSIEAEIMSDGQLILSKSTSATTYTGYITISEQETYLLLNWLADLHAES